MYSEIPLIYLVHKLTKWNKRDCGLCVYYSAAASGWARWALAHPEFGSSVNPITTRGADYAHHITASPPRFENPASSLHYLISTEGEHDGIESRLPFKIFSSLIMLGTP